MRASDADPGWSERADALQVLAGHMRRHLAIAHFGYSAAGVASQALFTGFFFRWVGRLFWVTAAHCIEQMQELRTKADALIGPRFYDVADAKQPGMPLPLFDLVREHPASDDVDVAVVQISGHWRRLLEANKLFYPLDEVAIRGCESTPMDAMCLVGLPVAWTEERRGEAPTHTSISFRSDYACVPVRTKDAVKTSMHPEGFWDRPHCLYREVILPDGTASRAMDSVVGMSGGPVFSLHDDADGLRYRLVGIQSRWLRESRILRIEPTRALVALLTTLEAGGLLLPDDVVA